MPYLSALHQGMYNRCLPIEIIQEPVYIGIKNYVDEESQGPLLKCSRAITSDVDGASYRNQGDFKRNIDHLLQ